MFKFESSGTSSSGRISPVLKATSRASLKIPRWIMQAYMHTETLLSMQSPDQKCRKVLLIHTESQTSRFPHTKAESEAPHVKRGIFSLANLTRIRLVTRILSLGGGDYTLGVLFMPASGPILSTRSNGRASCMEYPILATSDGRITGRIQLNQDACKIDEGSSSMLPCFTAISTHSPPLITVALH